MLSNLVLSSLARRFCWCIKPSSDDVEAAVPLLDKRTDAQPNSCSCSVSWGSFKDGFFKTAAILGASTAFHGAYEAATDITDSPEFWLGCCTLAFMIASVFNLTATPAGRIRDTLLLGQPESPVGKVLSPWAALCSACLAAGTPYNLRKIIWKLAGHAAETEAPIYLIMIGLLVLFCNFVSSYSVGNHAIINFKLITPEISRDLDIYPLAGTFAVMCAVFFGVIMLMPYVDGISDTLAGIAAHDGSFEERLQYLCSGAAGAPIDRKTLYLALYWTFFAVNIPANIVALLTVTFGKSYQFFKALFIRTQQNRRDFEKQIPALDLATKISISTIAAVIAASYALVFAGFGVSTFNSDNWNWLGLGKNAIRGISYAAAGTTWFPLLVKMTYSKMPVIRRKERNFYYVALQNYALALHQFHSSANEKYRQLNQQYALTITENQVTTIHKIIGNCETVMYVWQSAAGPRLERHQKPQTKDDKANAHIDNYSRVDMVEFLGHLFTYDELEAAYENSMRDLKNDPRSDTASMFQNSNVLLSFPANAPEFAGRTETFIVRAVYSATQEDTVTSRRPLRITISMPVIEA